MLSWLWYRLCGPLYRVHRWLTDPHIRRYGMHASDCPWCGDDLHGAYLHRPYFMPERRGRSTTPGESTEPGGAGVQQCPRCHYRWRVRDRIAPGA
jgi:hypothetical protein